jgi:hypothetical protein
MTWQLTTHPTKLIAPLAKRLGYRKREFSLNVTDKVTLSGLNWSGGTKSEYHMIRLDDMAIASPDLGAAAPWNNRAEGMEIDLPVGYAIARTGWFCGHVSKMTLYVRADNLPPALTAN